MSEEITNGDFTYKLYDNGFHYGDHNLTEEEKKLKSWHPINQDEVKLAESWIDALRQAGEYQLFSADEKLSYYTQNKIRGSYSLKHTAERWAGSYISNGAMIQAARNKGLATIHEEGINCQIGIYFTKKQRNEYYLHGRNIPMTQGDVEREKKEQRERQRSALGGMDIMWKRATREAGCEVKVSHEVSTLFKEIK